MQNPNHRTDSATEHGQACQKRCLICQRADRQTIFLYYLPIRGSIPGENASSYLSVNREDNESIFHLITETNYQYMDLNYPAYICN